MFLLLLLLFVGLAFRFLLLTESLLQQAVETTTNVHQKNETGDASARSAGLCPAPVLPGELQPARGAGRAEPPPRTASAALDSKQAGSEGQGRAGRGSGVGGSSRRPEESKEQGAAAGKGSQPSRHSLGSSAGLRFAPQSQVVPSVPSPAPCPLLGWGVQGQPRGVSWSKGSWGPAGHGDRLELCSGSLSPLLLTPGDIL